MRTSLTDQRGRAATVVLVVVGFCLLWLASPGRALAAGGQISGTVTSSGSPVSSVDVNVYDAGQNFVASTLTASDGTYTVSGLAAGTYEVGFVPSSGSLAPEFYSDEPSLATADAVTVTASTPTTGIDAALVEGGQISGTVTDASSGTGLGSVEVDVYDTGGSVVAKTETAADGTYTVSALFPENYRVGFVPTSGDFASQFYNDKPSLATADVVTVTAGSTNNNAVSAALAAGGQIAGTVTDAASGAGVGRAQVVVYDSSDTVVASTTTAVDGTYAVLGLSPGSYEVGFFPAGPYAVQFYSGRATLAPANDVSVTSGATTGGIDAALQPPTSTLSVSLAGSGSGTVTGTGISCPGTCAQSYPTDSSVTLTASAAAGSTFAGWTGGGCGTASVCTVALSAGLAVTADFSANVVVLSPPSAPSDGVLPSVVGSARTGQTLSARTGSWSGTAPLAYSYQWQRCVQGCGNIAGATGSSYRLVTADTGARIVVVVTAGNVAGRVSAMSAAVGPVQPSVAQIKSLLTSALVPSGKPARLAAILKAGGYTFTVKAAVAGHEEIRWYVVPAGAHLTKGKPPKPELVGTGNLTFSRAGRGKLKLRLSASGRRTLKRAKRIKLSAKASFAPVGIPTVSVIKGFTLRR